MPQWMIDLYIKVLKRNILIKDLIITYGYNQLRTFNKDIYYKADGDLDVQEWIDGRNDDARMDS